MGGAYVKLYEIMQSSVFVQTGMAFMSQTGCLGRRLYHKNEHTVS